MNTAVSQKSIESSQDARDGPEELLMEFDSMDIGKPTRPLILMLPLITFSLIALVIAILSIYFYTESERVVISKESEELEHANEIIKSIINQFYSNNKNSISYISQYKYLADLDQSETILSLFKEQLRNTIYYSSISIINRDGEVLLSVKKDNASLEADYVYYEEGFRLTEDERRYIYNLSVGEVYFTKENMPESKDLDDVSISSVIRVANNSDYALIVDIQLGHFLNEVIFKKQDDISFYWLGNSGEYITNPRVISRLKGERIQNDIEIFSDIFNNNIKEYEIDPYNVNWIEHPAFYSLINLSHHGAVYPLRLLMIYSDNDHITEIGGIGKRFIYAGTLLSFFVLFVVWLLTRYLLSPLRKMSLAIDSYEKADDVEQLPLNAPDEIGVLSRIFYNLFNKKEEKEKQLIKKNEKINELSQRLDFALDAPGIGVWDYDLNTKKLYWDERMYHIYNTYDKVFLGDFSDWCGYLHKADIQQFSNKFYYAIETRDEFVDEYRIIWPNGDIRWVSIHGCVISDEEDNPIRVIGTNMDITNRKKLELDREQALNKAKESAQLKSEFLASMSHEIRTPINGVLGMLGLLGNTQLTQQQSHYLSLASVSAESLLSIVNDILDFSKVEAGKMDLDLIDFHLPDMLGDFAEAIAHRAQQKGLELVLDVSGIKDTYVKGDPGRIRQILNNLTGNAIKFTDTGEISIALQLIKKEKGGLQLECVISDTGIGIPKEKVQRLFQSFSQVDASTTRKYGGTGLGLAIVRKLCMLMDGDVNVISTPGQGSHFIFCITLQESEQNQLLMPSVDITGTPILVVDDNATNLTVLGNQLRCWGADVVTCDSAQSALNVLETRQENMFAIAILDMQMSHMGGDELGRMIRSQVRYDSIKLVIMTSLSQRGDAKRYAELGFSAFFPKPATMNDLFGALNVLVDDGDALQKATPLLTRHFLRSLEGSGEQKAPIDASKIRENENKQSDVRILLVEDNLINQEVVLGILEMHNLRADIANNGLQALEKLNAPDALDNPYDLVLMDCQMPEMDGYDATRAIRSGKVPNPNIPIIAMTANAMKGDREKCLETGMNDYISKPVDPDKVFLAIQQWSNFSKERAEDKKEEVLVMSESDQVIWDREDFMRRIMNNETIANKLIALFKTDTPKTIEQLQEAIESEQVTEAGLIAHKLKGSVSNLGGVELASLAKKIEQAGKEDNMEEVKALWPQVIPGYEKLLQHIESNI